MRYRTVRAPSRHAIDPIKGSRFIATVAPAPDEAAALARVREVRDEMADARHHCFAWRLDDDHTRASDDGEPGGSAGRPILAQIVGHELHRTVVVVTRYFGGVKLGVGGLIRAYGGAAGKALDRAAIVTVDRTARLTLVHRYEDTSAVATALAAEGLEVAESDYGAEVRLVLEVPLARYDAVRGALLDATGGRARLARADPPPEA